VKRPPPIRTPCRQHLRRVRYQLLPVVVFCACVLAVSWLWNRHLGGATVVGEVASTSAPVQIRPLIDGWLVALEGKTWQAFDEVSAGDLLAKMDDAPAKAALETVAGDVAVLHAQLAEARLALQAERTRRLDAHAAEARRLAVDIENIRLDMLDRRTRTEVDKIQLKRRAETLAVLRKLVAEGVQNEYALADATLRRDTLAKQISQDQAALAEMRDTLLKAAVQRQNAHAERNEARAVAADVELAARLNPITKAIAAQELRVKELALQVDRLELRSPIAGQIVTIGFRPGETVAAGDLIMTVAPARGDYIVSYIPENRPIEPKVNAFVNVRVRSRPPQIVRAQIARVGPRIQLVPEHQRRDPAVPEWGLPVKIALPPKPPLRPGQLVDVFFRNEH